jgi:preprotein translocase subunit SecD
VARPGASRGLHVGRYLGALAAILVLLYTIVALAGPNNDPLTPKLGLDLQGGASVILTPKTTPKSGQLQTAVDILNRRVNGAGVAEAEVVTQGNNIVVSLPGGNRDSIAGLATTAQLRFREVLQALPGSNGATATASPQPTSATVTTTTKPSAKPAPSATASKKASGRALSAALVAAPTPSPTTSSAAKPAATPTPSASSSAAADDGVLVHTGDPYTPQALAALDCTDKKARRSVVDDDPTKPIVACSQEGDEKFQLDVAKVVGTDVKTATAQRDQQLGEWQIIVKFTGKGQNKWTDLTAATVGKRVAIALDAVVISAPNIQERIDGDAQISGQFTRDSSADLANVLKYGALPLSFSSGEVQVVSPTLGKDQLHSGLLAGGIGLIAVIIYSLLYYRMMGFVTIASLIMSGLLVYASVAILGKQIGFALSLAGIAGFIVAVGITADSFVVFFERLKDEIKEGRTPRSAVDRAWVRARRTILSADTVSFLAAIILYFVSVGGVRGFAFTLGLSTLLDVVVVFLFTRPLVSWLSRYAWFSNHKFTGFYGPEGGAPVTNTRRTPSTPALPNSEV